MNSIERFLYLNRILKFTEAKLEKWHQKEATEKLIFAAQNGIYNIRLKCVNYLSKKISESDIKDLIISLVSDEVEVVSVAAMTALEQSPTLELSELIQQTKAKWQTKKQKERQKKHVNSYAANIQLDGTRKQKPSERLINNLRKQQASFDAYIGI